MDYFKKVFKTNFQTFSPIICNNKRGIYCIRNNSNGKMYFGHTINLGKRIYEHIRTLRLNQHPNNYLQNSFNKNGESEFNIYYCEFNATKPVLRIIEDYYVKKFGCYNLTEPICEGEKYKKKYRVPVTKTVILYRYNLQGQLINIYEDVSIKHIAKRLGYNYNEYANICYSIKNRTPTNQFYYSLTPISENEFKIRYITQYDRTGKFIKNWFVSVEDISKEVNETKSGIYSCLYKTSPNISGNFLWKYNFKNFGSVLSEDNLNLLDFIKEFKIQYRIVGIYDNDSLKETWLSTVKTIAKYYNISQTTVFNSIRNVGYNRNFRIVQEK